MNYLRLLKDNYKTWKLAKELEKRGKPLWRGMLPSSTYLKYPPYHSFNGKKVLNFGSGEAVYVAPNVVNTDCIPGKGVNIVILASEIRLPFADNTFDHIIANHVMEHLPNWFETMKEFARVCKVGGMIEIWFPPVSSDTAFTYRDHLNRLGQESFAGCNSVSRPGSNILAAKEFKELGEFGKLVLVERYRRTIVTWWTMLAPESLLEWMCEHLRNIVSEEGYKFIKGE